MATFLPLIATEVLPELPHALAAAFAARCAKRVQPLLSPRNLLGVEPISDAMVTQARSAASFAMEIATGTFIQDGSSAGELREQAETMARESADLRLRAWSELDRADFFATDPRGMDPDASPGWLQLYHVIVTGLVYGECGRAAALSAAAAANYAAAAALTRNQGDAVRAVDEMSNALVFGSLHAGASFVKKNAQRFHREGTHARKALSKSIARDVQGLRRLADQSADNNVPLPAHHFATHTNFVDEVDLYRELILGAISKVSKKSIPRLAKYPDSLYVITPREFEVVVSEILASRGFEVSLTKQTRDGGYDIVALHNDTFGIRCIVECKRLGRENKVGIGIVRALHGVVEDQRATKGIVVTTSGFTRDARAYIARNRWRLDGHDYSTLVDWLEGYQDRQLTRITKGVVGRAEVLETDQS